MTAPPTPQHESRFRYRSHLQLSWREERVNISGLAPPVVVELSACLGLRSPTSVIGTSDVVVSRRGSEATVECGAQSYTVKSPTDLFLLLSTLVPAILMQKSGVSRRMHAAGIQVGQGLLLLSGEGYAGKSSISLAAWRRGLQVLGDDWLLFSRDFTGLTPIPKPLKARMAPDDFAKLQFPKDQCRIYFGNLFGETRVLLGRGDGFYNHWDRPLPVNGLVFLERSEDHAPVFEQISIAQALPLLLSQTILCENSKTLSGVAFARALAKRDVPVFKMRLGRSTPDTAFDAILERTKPWF